MMFLYACPSFLKLIQAPLAQHIAVRLSLTGNFGYLK